MSEDRNFLPFVIVCLALVSLAISGLVTCRLIANMEKRMNELEEENKSILYQYELQDRQIAEIKSLNATYASETDAKLNLLAGDLQDVKLEKEVNNVELHQEEEPSGMTYYGVMELTAYEETDNPCADGQYPQVGFTAACNDPGLWYKWVYIDGVGEYYIHDTGGMASNVIDIYMGDVSACYEFGRRSADVYIIDK